MEEWRPVVGIETRYDVSSKGRVRGKSPIGRLAGGGILKTHPNHKGYLRVGLMCGNKYRKMLVHRLVLEAFIGPKPSLIHQANHKNGRKTDNRASNLEWVTPIENNEHSVANGFWHPHIGESHGRAKLSNAKVRRILRMRGETTAAALGRQYGVSGTAISLIWRGKNWKHVKVGDANDA